MRVFEQERGPLLGTRLHLTLILSASAAGLLGAYLAAGVAAGTGGAAAATVSIVTILPLLYWPLHAAVAGDWLPAVMFYGGWCATMLLTALYETTYCLSSVERPWRPKPR